MIKIVSPITKLDEAKSLIEAGANEFYCGVLTEEENRYFTNMCCLNRRPSFFSNLKDFKELAQLVRIAREKVVKVSLVLNEFYTEQQFDNVKLQIEKAVDLGVDAIIAADLGVIEELRQNGNKIKIYIGVGGTAFNYKTVEFYKKLGVERVILPRHLRLHEIADMCSKIEDGNPDLECLILNERCHNIDGFCGFEHGVFSYKKASVFFKHAETLRKIYRFLPRWFVDFMHVYGMKKELACCFDYKIDNKKEESAIFKKNTKRFDNFFDINSFLNACGACALYDLKKMDMKFVKIVGRVFFKDKVNDVRFISHCLNLLEDSSLDAGEYKRLAQKAYKKHFDRDCDKRYCYYPD